MDITEIIGIILGVFGAVPSYVIAWIEYKKWVKENPNYPSLSKWLREIQRSYPFLLGIFFTMTMIALFVLPPSPEPEIIITSPSDNDLVPQEITVEGYANEELRKNQHLYIVVEYGGQWWPQYSEVTIGYSPTSMRYKFTTPAIIGKEEDIGRKFIIRAILVDSTIHQHFQNWFKQHTGTEEWSGIAITEVNQMGKVKMCDYITVTRR